MRKEFMNAIIGQQQCSLVQIYRSLATFDSNILSFDSNGHQHRTTNILSTCIRIECAHIRDDKNSKQRIKIVVNIIHYKLL